ncbi:unnamed protein product [Cylindrotheca closterium]|uniref:Uncharacterized protein n=1 Tax=Cylindrotheca closterium TaxID=2856 RepID=A0AAD2FX20_9STRA|nr:unnamed protein product [Cylindrotheca closterium]
MTSPNRTQNKMLLPAVVEMEEPLLDTRKATNEDENSENKKVRLHGAVIGFLTQLINISGTAVITYRWGPNADLFAEHASILDHAMHLFVSMASQVDLFLYLVMWLGLTAALTDRGIEMWQQFLGGPHSARSIFVMGVQFYAGVVIGSFLSWFSLDFALGLPAPVYPMVSVLFFGLVISYSMVWCFDMEDNPDEREDACV